MPKESPRKPNLLATGFLVLYIVFLCACAVVALLLPPGTPSGMAGILGAFATLAAGLPWSVLILGATSDCNVCAAFPGGRDGLFTMLSWGGALLNVIWLASAAGWAQVPREPPPPRAASSSSSMSGTTAPQPVAATPFFGPRMPVRVKYARFLETIARTLDATRELRRVTVTAVLVTVLLGLPSFMGLLQAAQDGAAGALALWSLGVLSALVGSWCRLLSSSWELQHSSLRFGFALVGTACGTVLALRTAIGSAPYAPGWALFTLLLAGCQGYLLAATVGSRWVAPRRDG